MKELMTYVAIDTDNVGESIGNAVLSNDVDSLSSISENINSGVQVFSQWAEYNGGKVISSGSDEAIFQVPQSSIKDLEELKNTYTEQTGFTISIGIGENVSDAAKALIYAKMNGKDQIMDYSPEMERAMKESLTGDVQRLEGGVGDDSAEGEFEEEDLEVGKKVEAEHTDNPEEQEEIAEDHLTEEEDYYDGEGAGGEQLEEDIDEAQEEVAAEEEGLVDDLENEMEENVDEELAQEEAEEEQEDEALDEMAESDNEAEEDIDLDGQPDASEEHGEIMPEDDLDGDGDVEHEEAMAGEAGEEEEYSDEGDFSDEVEDSDELSEAIEGEMEEEMNPDDFAVEDEMPEGEEVMDEAVAIEEEMEGDDFADTEGEENLDHEAIKDVIFESLQNFKQNRDYLEGISQENPELYQSLIFTLQAMIEMAKEFGYGEVEEDMLSDEDEVMGAMAEEEEMNPDEFAVEEEGEEEMNPDDFAVAEEEEEEEAIEKNERLLKLVYKMHRSFELLGEMKKAKVDEGKSQKQKIKDRQERSGAVSEKPKRKERKKADGKFDTKWRKQKGVNEAHEEYHKDVPKFDGESVEQQRQVSRDNAQWTRENRPNLPKSENGFEKSEEDKTVEEMKEEAKEKLESKSKKKGPSKKKRKPSVKKPKVPGKKKKKPQKSSNDGSFCARSHNKMRQSGKDCRSNEDKHSPLCSARRKFNCRGKNEEKGSKLDKAEKLKQFLKKKYENEELEKARLATKQTTKHTTKPHHAEGTQKGYKVKDIDNETGKTQWIDGSRGLAMGPDGDPVGPGGRSPVAAPPQKIQKV